MNLSPICPDIYSVFHGKAGNALAHSELGVRLLSCVICGRGRPRSEIRANFEGTKITFVTFLTQK